MLRHIKMINIGPAPEMEIVFGERLNMLTGDNGLGKSFLLDIAWWSMTRRWPAEINPALTAGKKAQPTESGEATISFSFNGENGQKKYSSSFLRKKQIWDTPSRGLANPGLVIYAMTDGSFAVWDPARNDWPAQDDQGAPERRPAYVFSPSEVWNGLHRPGSPPICNGLVMDWSMWQKERGESYIKLSKVLQSLSPSESEPITPGKLTRIGLEDSRDIPTIKMPYGQEVPVLHASAGMRRIMALAYLLIWSWQEHQKASELMDEPATNQIVFLIDEIESHLHPRWQFSIMGSLMGVMKSLSPSARVQLIASTHSPLVMASVEPLFDVRKDAWFDLDYDPETKGRVILTRRPFEPQGDVSNWLTSEAFDLSSARSPKIECLLDEASGLLNRPDVTSEAVEDMRQRLVSALNPRDGFLFRWRTVAQKKGLLP